ncbi:MAG TPA: hypothetical protein VK196_19635 [Magnetospirillum sp.]|nr:hypothetical protein [Magnetospirillum sp.]
MTVENNSMQTIHRIGEVLLRAVELGWFENRKEGSALVLPMVDYGLLDDIMELCGYFDKHMPDFQHRPGMVARAAVN